MLKKLLGITLLLFILIGCQTSYTINFDSMGGSEVSSITTDGSSRITLPSAPTKDGYAFGGWFLDKDSFNDEFSVSESVSKDITVYAKWLDIYTVNFNSDGGSVVTSRAVREMDSLSKPTDPTKEGYDFLGWYKNDTLTEPWDFSTDIVDSDLTLYAMWNPLVRDITFNTNGGTSVDSIEGLVGKVISEPGNPVKDGHIFLGWYKNSDLSETWDFSENKVVNSMTLFAKWEEILIDSILLETIEYDPFVNEILSFNVLFAPDNAFNQSFIWSSSDETIASFHNDLLTIHKLGEVTITVTSPDGKISDTLTLEINDFGFNNKDELEALINDNAISKELYLLQDLEELTLSTAVSINFNGHHVDIVNVETTESGTFDLLGNGSIDTLNIDAPNATINNEVTVNQETKIYAVSNNSFNTRAIHLGNINVLGQGRLILGGKATDASVEVNTEKMVILSGEFKNTVTLNATNASIQVRGVVHNLITNNHSIIHIMHDGELKAIDNNDHAVNIYVEDGGAIDKDIDVPFKDVYKVTVFNHTITSIFGNYIFMESGETITGISETPTRTGYNFLGWYHESDFKNTVDFSKPVTEALTLYAKWEITKYEVTFNDDYDTQIINYNQRASEPTLETKEGYTFRGWFIDEELSSAFSFRTRITQPFTLYTKWEINSYTVEFRQTTIDSIKVDYNNELTLPSNPERDGYTFAGWYLDSGYDTAYSPQKITSNLTLFAKWDINSYDVNFDSGVDSQSIEYNQLASRPTTPIKEGYTFINWFLDEDYTTLYNFNTRITESISLYAKWEAMDKHPVYFETGSGTTIPTQTVYENETVSKPSNPNKDGHTFIGWYTTDAYTTEFDFDNTEITIETYIYALWKVNQYTVNFDTTIQTTTIASIELDYNELLEKPQIIEKEGYTFIGWSFEDKIWEFNNDRVPAKDFTLTAEWSIIEYTVTFDSKGGTNIPDEDVDYNGKISEPIIPEKEGYTFIGWYYGETLWDFDVSIPNEPITLVAEWQINQYTVSFETDVDGLLIENQSITYGALIVNPELLEKTGYTFIGWTHNGDIWDFEVDTQPDESITLVAKWEINQYTITFENAEGEMIYERISDYDALIIEPSNPEKEGFTFIEWQFEGEEWLFFSDKIPDKDITLVSYFEINSYTITFDTNSELEVDAISIKYNESLDLPTLDKEFYNFLGWYLDNDLFDVTTMPALENSEIVLVAKWEFLETPFVVSFDTDGGTVIPDETVIVFEPVEEPLEPTKDGFNFIGWYTDDTFTELYDFNDPIMEETILYALFEQSSFTITFETNGGSSVSPITLGAGNEIDLPEEPTRTGFKFTGWYTEDNTTTLFEDTTMPDSNVSLYAGWDRIEYTIEFLTNDGSPIEDLKVGYNLSIDMPDDPEKEGYTFIGWYIDEEFTDSFELTIMPNNDLVLYANYEINDYSIVFNTNEGSSINTISIAYNSTIILPNNPTREGYRFTGWYLDNDLSQKFNYTLMPDQDLNLYAAWTIENYTISFNTMGAEDIESITQAYNTAIDLPIPERTEYTFMGWYTDGTLTTKFEQTTMPAETIDLYARWE